MPQPLTHSLSAFLQYLQFEKRYSPHTLTAYRKDLEDFSAFLEAAYGEQAPEAASAAQVRTWLAALKEQGLSSRSLNRKISTLRSLFKYLVRTGKQDHNPMERIIAPKGSRRLPVFVDRPSMERLLQPGDAPQSFEGLTEGLVLALLYDTGIRRAELVGLRTAQVDHAAGCIRVLGKGSKERIIPVSPALLEAIRGYQCAKARLPGADEEYLLVTPRGRPLYPQYVYRLVRRRLGAVTTLAKRSPHVLRHTFATHLTAEGADLNAVKELLGHASLAATQVYVHNTIAQLKAVYDQAHPKSGEE